MRLFSWMQCTDYLEHLLVEGLIPCSKWSLYQITSALGCFNWNHLSVRCRCLHHLKWFIFLYFFLLCILCKVRTGSMGLRYWKPAFYDGREKVHRELFIVVLEKKFEITNENDLYIRALLIKILSYSHCINECNFHVKVSTHTHTKSAPQALFCGRYLVAL